MKAVFGLGLVSSFHASHRDWARRGMNGMASILQGCLTSGVLHWMADIIGYNVWHVGQFHGLTISGRSRSWSQNMLRISSLSFLMLMSEFTFIAISVSYLLNTFDASYEDNSGREYAKCERDRQGQDEIELALWLGQRNHCRSWGHSQDSWLRFGMSRISTSMNEVMR